MSALALAESFCQNTPGVCSTEPACLCFFFSFFYISFLGSHDALSRCSYVAALHFVGDGGLNKAPLSIHDVQSRSSQ
jgi:hypothetical protein